MWESDLKGAELLMAIAIADHADHNGECFPGLDSLAAKVKLKKRQVQDLIDRLEKKGIIQMVRGIGRGHKTIFRFQKVQESAPIKPKEKVQVSAIKGAGIRKEKVQVSASPSYKEEPLIEPILTEGENRPVESDFGEAERQPVKTSLFYHPAIVALRKITKHNPPKESWGLLSKRLGVDVDIGRLTETVAEWRAAGNRATNFTGIVDWYLGERKDNGKNQRNNPDSNETHDDRVIAKSKDFYANYRP